MNRDGRIILQRNINIKIKKHLLSPFKLLVIEWTKKAQSFTLSDAERMLLYECTKKLHAIINEVEDL